MKSKIKRHSRSILAVILTISMLISTMMVGLIATDAARVADDDEVSWNSSTDRLHIRIGSTWYDKYFNSAGVTTFEVPSDNTTIEFELNFNGTVYKLDSSQANFTAKGIRSTAGQTRLTKTSGSSTYTVSGVYQGTYTATLDGIPSNGEQKLKISGPGGGDDPTTSGPWYLLSYYTSWDNDVVKSYPMTEVSTNLYKYVVTSWNTNQPYFRFMLNDSTHSNCHYGADTGNKDITINNKYSISANGNNFMYNDGTGEKVIWLDTSENKAWIADPLPDIANTLTLTADKYVLTAENETVTFTATAVEAAKPALTYNLYESGNATPLQTIYVNDGSAVTFNPVTPNSKSKTYYATVESTDDSTSYNEVQSENIVITNSNDAYKPNYTVTINVDNADKTFGTVKAVTTYNNGSASTSSTVTTGSVTVKEGYSVTITATPAAGCIFKGWTGTTEAASSFTTTVYSNINVTADFAQYGFKVYDGAHYSNMRELPNGTWISVNSFAKVNDNSGWLTVERLEDEKYINAGAKSDTYWLNDGTKNDVSWGSIQTDSKAYYTNHAFDPAWLVYDPVNDKLWLSETDADNPGVTVIAKNGTIRDDSKTHTSDFGTTTVELVSPSTITGTVNNNAYDSRAVEYSLSKKDVNAGVKLKIKTQVKQTYREQGYYVKGFVVSGYEETFSILNQEFSDTSVTVNGKERYPEAPSYDDKNWIDSGYNEFTLTIDGYPDKPIEITPIYYKKETYSGDNVRFYVDGFAGDVKTNWGDTLAVDFYGERTRPFGEYPGQPMINYNGRYMVDLPRSDVKGITLNNYIWDRVHSDLFYGTSGMAIEGTTGSDVFYNKVTENHYQTYDFNDFKYISDKLTSLNQDEDIIFSFKYKHDDTIVNSRSKSNLGKDTYYVDSQTEPGAAEHYNSSLDYSTNHNTINPSEEAIYQFEPLTDFYGNRVDLMGNLIDITGNETKAAQYPIRVVSNGYDRNKAGTYATAWAIYTPATPSGDAPGTYTLKDVVGGQGRKYQDYQSESFFIDPESEARVRFKYDSSIRDDSTIYVGPDAQNNETVLAHWQRKFREQNNGSISYPDLIEDLTGRPVEITYEYEVKSGISNDNTEKETGNGQVSYRSDGRWYYSNSETIVKAHILVEYAEKEGGTYVRDYFQGSNIDYKQSGYDPSAHDGLTTGVKAYFTNDGTYNKDGKIFTNTNGYTEATGITDGDYSFDLKTEGDQDGNYTFVGWYLLVDGKYTLITRDEVYKSEATNNDVYVARYVKTPSGNVTVTHNLTNDSDGTAKCYTKVDIVNGDTVVDNTTYPETTNAVKVGTKYIKSNSENSLKITLRTVPGAHCTFDEFKESITGTLRTLTQEDIRSAFSDNDDTVVITNDSANKTYTAVITIKIAALFDSDGNQTTKALPFFSKVSGLKYKIYFDPKSYRNLYQGMQYKVGGLGIPFSEEELAQLTNETSGSSEATGSSITNIPDFDTDAHRTAFINNHAPYENGFMETYSWNTALASVTNKASDMKVKYNESTHVITYIVKGAEEGQRAVKVRFQLPYNASYENSLQADLTDGDANQTDYQEYGEDNVLWQTVYKSHYTINGNYVKAPEKLLVSNENSVKTYTFFKYWEVYNMPTAKTSSELYTKCYYPEFNLTIYQDSIIKAVYGNETSVSPSDQALADDNDIKEKGKATITFMENSRTQWTASDNSPVITSDKGKPVPDSYQNGGDRIYTDFLISYTYKDLLLKDSTKLGFIPGLVVETAGELPKENGEYVTKDQEYYKTHYDTTKTPEALNSFIQDTSKSADGNYLKSEFTLKELDNKNRINYYYSLPNIKHSDLTATTRKNMVYRAYSYLRNGSSLVMVSEPVYFTIYDIASIANSTAGASAGGIS